MDAEPAARSPGVTDASDAGQVPAGPRENPARELVAALWRGKLTIALVFLLVTGAVTFAVLRTPPLFEAESRLLVRVGREYAYRSETGETESTRMPSLAEMVNSEVEILSGRDLAERVVREIGVARLYPELIELEPDPELAVQRAVQAFRPATSIRPVLDSSVIKVSFEHAEPQVAADAVNRLVERFKEKHVEVFGEQLLADLEVELATRTRDLAQAEEALADFKRESGAFDLDEQKRLLLGQRARAEDELRTSELALSGTCPATVLQEEPQALLELPPQLSPDMKDELLRQRAEVERELRTLALGVPDRLVEEASMRLLDLQLEESRLLRDYSESNRQVQGVRAEIERVRDFLSGAEHRAGALDQARRRDLADRADVLQAESARLAGEIELLVRHDQQREHLEERERVRTLALQRDDHVQRLAALESQLSTLDQQGKTLHQLARALASAEASLAACQQRVDEARIAEQLDREKRINVRVIEPAEALATPLGLSRPLKIALGAFVGLLAGAGLAVLLDLLRGR